MTADELFDCGLALQQASEALLTAALKIKAASAGSGFSTTNAVEKAEVAGAMLTAAQVAERLHLAKSTVYRLIESGALPSVRIGRARRVREADLASWAGHVPEPEVEIRQPVTKWGRPVAVALPKRAAR